MVEDGCRMTEDGRWMTVPSPSSTTEVRVQCEEWVFDGKAWVPKSGKRHRQIRSCRDLDVFNLGYTLAMEIFRLSTQFPKEERYALTDQIRRSSRAVCSNITEGFAKRRHEAVFKNCLNNSLGEAEETKVWLYYGRPLHDPFSVLRLPSSIFHTEAGL